MNDNLIPRKSSLNIDLETEDAFPSTESGGNIQRLQKVLGKYLVILLGEIPDGEIKDLAKIEVQQILVKAKHQAKFNERQNAPYTNSFNVTPTYGLLSPSKPYPPSIHSLTFS